MSRLSFPKKFRITKRPLYVACYSRGRRYFTPHFILFVLPQGIGHWRLGIAASKKIGSAVKRNRLKRLIREFFRLHQKEINVSADIVVIPKKTKDLHKLNLQIVKQELTAAIHAIQKDLLIDLQAGAKS